MEKREYGKLVTAPAEVRIGSQIKFALTATSKDDWRGFDLVTLRDDGILFGTDGRRIHMVRDFSWHSLEPGKSYQLMKKAKKIYYLAEVVNAQKLEIDRFLSTDEYKKIGEFLNTHKNKSDSSVFIAKLLRSFPEPAAINISYLQDLSSGYMWDVLWKGYNQPIRFDSGKETALIMPMRME